MLINPYRFAAGGTGFLLDDYAGASAGYSLRALSASYETTNPVVEVIRTGDSAFETFTDPRCKRAFCHLGCSKCFKC